MNCHTSTRALFNAIHNPPSLEKLIFRYPTFNIEDLKTLHAGATKLKYLMFTNSILYTDVAENQGPSDPAEPLETFIMTGTRTLRIVDAEDDEGVFEVEELDYTVANLISLIGVKYP